MFGCLLLGDIDPDLRTIFFQMGGATTNSDFCLFIFLSTIAFTSVHNWVRCVSFFSPQI